MSASDPVEMLVADLAEYPDTFLPGADREGVVYWTMGALDAFHELQREGWTFTPPDERAKRGQART